MTDRPTNRQWGGLAMIAGALLLAPVAAFRDDPIEAAALGACTVLLLALGASLLPSPNGREPA